jgi:putative addiction module CopG family antidote
MRSTKQLSITLPHKLAKAVRDKVASGEYASESEVVREGLRSLTARDQILERWLLKQAIPAHDALEADPTRAIPAAKVKANLLAAHRRAKKTARS